MPDDRVERTSLWMAAIPGHRGSRAHLHVTDAMVRNAVVSKSPSGFAVEFPPLGAVRGINHVPGN